MENSNTPAYPILDKAISEGVDLGLELKAPGLTKREMFAMAAMQGLCSNSFFIQQLGKYEDQAGPDAIDPYIAGRSIEIADELLKQLES
jgi:hypothetical protein